MTFADAEGLITALPEVTEGRHFGRRTWFVRDTSFAWERPFSKADIKRFGDQTPPSGPILALRTADMVEKAAILATSSPAFFDIQHFSGYPGYLIQLEVATEDEVREAVLDAWLAVAPAAVADVHMAKQRA